jgi:hypothetical protein
MGLGDDLGRRKEEEALTKKAESLKLSSQRAVVVAGVTGNPREEEPAGKLSAEAVLDLINDAGGAKLALTDASLNARKYETRQN